MLYRFKMKNEIYCISICITLRQPKSCHCHAMNTATRTPEVNTIPNELGQAHVGGSVQDCSNSSALVYCSLALSHRCCTDLKWWTNKDVHVSHILFEFGKILNKIGRRISATGVIIALFGLWKWYGSIDTWKKSYWILSNTALHQ